MCGQKFGQKLVKQLRIEKIKKGEKKNQSSTMFEDWEELTLSIQMKKSTKKFSKKREEKTGKTDGRSHAVENTTQ